MTYHGGARDLAEGPDMRQARRPVAGREQHLVLGLVLEPHNDRLRLLERPGVGLLGERAQFARTGGKVDRGHLEGLSPAKPAVLLSQSSLRAKRSNPSDR